MSDVGDDTRELADTDIDVAKDTTSHDSNPSDAIDRTDVADAADDRSDLTDVPDGADATDGGDVTDATDATDVHDSGAGCPVADFHAFTCGASTCRANVPDSTPSTWSFTDTTTGKTDATTTAACEECLNCHCDFGVAVAWSGLKWSCSESTSGHVAYIGSGACYGCPPPRYRERASELSSV